MTTDLEKQFFDTFGIEPDVESCYRSCYHKCETKSYLNCKDCDKATVIYPQITDRILLELICILSKYQKDVGSLLEICETDKNSIKEEVLDMLIFRDIALKQQVQALFKEQ